MIRNATNRTRAAFTRVNWIAMSRENVAIVPKVFKDLVHAESQVDIFDC